MKCYDKMKEYNILERRVDMTAMEKDSLEGEKAFIVGEVKKIIFENKSDFFVIMAVEISETNIAYDEDEIVVKGTFGEIKESLSYTFYGELTNHSKFGLQFNCSSYVRDIPNTQESLISYLSSSSFKGIGKVTAQRIVEKLGSNAITEIIKAPEVLDDIQGLNDSKATRLVQQLVENAGLETVFLQLNQYGISNQLAAKIYDKYGANAFQQIQKNPYILAKDFAQISFKKADIIAEQMGFEADSNFRLEAGLVYTTATHCARTGDTYIEEAELLKQTTSLLEASNRFVIDGKLLHRALQSTVEHNGLIEDQGLYYLLGLYHAEKNIATTVRYFLTHFDEERYDYSEADLDDALADIQNTDKITYGKSQIHAIKQALLNPFFILTGGPGTGKTTVVNAIVSVYAYLNDKSLDPHAYKDKSTYPFVLAAPTGRAAKHMAETTGIKSRTIHSLLGLKPGDENSNIGNDVVLEGELLIVDEMSMVDTWLLSKLLDAVPEGMQVILIGDKDQLPSVGPGQVYSDLIASQRVPTVELVDIYRQDANSTISFLARDIKNGQLPADFTENKADRSFIPAQPKQVLEAVETVVRYAIASGYSANECQVLAPMYKGQAGINALNKSLQAIFNPNDKGTRKEIQYFEQVFRINDKVLQLENDPENGVFNGDIGIITGIEMGATTSGDKLIVNFDQIEVEYLRMDFTKITLAYCMSIHKAQGSEFDCVVLPYTSDYYYMLKKDLLYTAITRASKSLILIGQKKAFAYSLEQTANNRKTTLIKRLQSDRSKVLKETNTQAEMDYRLNSELIKKLAIDPMIGMEDLTPQDFKMERQANH